MTRVVYDHAGEAISAGPERKLAILHALLDSGYGVTLPGTSGSLAPIDDADLLVLSENATAPADAEDAASGVTVRYRDVSNLDADGVVELVRSGGGSAQGSAPGEWTPWFPVIDYDRCTNCMQCLSFCLFGVYDVDEEKQIEVHEPQKCKTNCPACSRVCPEVAILFPKYKNGPINGDEVQAADIEREKMKTDISSILGGDIYSLLRQRHQKAQSRFSKERDEERALKERRRCLKKLQAEFDIPQELLDELPSADLIEARFQDRASSK